MVKLNNFSELPKWIDKDLPPTPWLTVNQEMINDFAKATGDHQWIHVDTVRAAKESPFGKTIAHGLMSVSMIPNFLAESMEMSSIKMGFNYGMESIRFTHPVPVDSQLRAHVKLLTVEPYHNGGIKAKYAVKVEIKGVEKPACVAQILVVAWE